MFPRIALLSLTFAVMAFGQQVGTLTAEVHPSLPAQKCTKAGGCVTVNTKIVLDANWRWLHTTQPNSYTNCYDGNKWNAALCPDPKTCASNCALEGVDYASTYGITTSGNAVSLKFVTGKNVGSRVYLMEDDNSYQMFNLLNKEFTFDVDTSNLPCGLNGAVYFSEMKKDGGMSGAGNNKAGAKYGTGYCDAQCPHDIKFIDGEANTIGWNGSSDNSGSGQYGTCCGEMDIWEANKEAAAFTPHPCTGSGPERCSGTACGDGDNRYNGVCDKDGCDWNSFRMGDKTFLGPGKTINTNKKLTLVTQFITDTGTDDGNLVEIRRIYVQDGVVYQNSKSTFPTLTGNSLTDNFCAAQKDLFSNTNHFKTTGGMAGMGASFKRGMVLALSLWDDYAAYALWLDSNYPADADPTVPGVARGPCGTDTGRPADVERLYPDATVTYSNIKWGELDSTYSGRGATTSNGPSGSTTGPVSSTSTTRLSTSSTRASTSSTRAPSSSTTVPTPTGGPAAPHWGQCGGKGWAGATRCESPYTCTVSNEYYSQCL